jgi:hypothetical protein
MAMPPDADRKVSSLERAAVCRGGRQAALSLGISRAYPAGRHARGQMVRRDRANQSFKAGEDPSDRPRTPGGECTPVVVAKKRQGDRRPVVPVAVAVKPIGVVASPLRSIDGSIGRHIVRDVNGPRRSRRFVGD